jgi:hypothetical protein
MQATTEPSTPPNASGKKANLGIKDWVTILFSAVALLISALTFFNNYRVKDEMQARVADLVPASGGRDAVVFRVAFSNSGNRPAIILDVDCIINDQPNMKGTAFSSGCKAPDKIFPLIIQPHDVRLVDVEVQGKALEESFNHGKRISLSGRGEVARFFCALQYSAIDSGGVYHQVLGQYIASFDVTSTRFAGFGLLGKEHYYPATELFQHG